MNRFIWMTIIIVLIVTFLVPAHSAVHAEDEEFPQVGQYWKQNAVWNGTVTDHRDMDYRGNWSETDSYMSEYKIIEVRNGIVVIAEIVNGTSHVSGSGHWSSMTNSAYSSLANYTIDLSSYKIVDVSPVLYIFRFLSKTYVRESSAKQLVGHYPYFLTIPTAFPRSTTIALPWWRSHVFLDTGVVPSGLSIDPAYALGAAAAAASGGGTGGGHEGGGSVETSFGSELAEVAFHVDSEVGFRMNDLTLAARSLFNSTRASGILCKLFGGKVHCTKGIEAHNIVMDAVNGLVLERRIQGTFEMDANGSYETSSYHSVIVDTNIAFGSHVSVGIYPKVAPITIDGIVYQASDLPKTFIWTEASKHSLSVEPIVQIENDSRYLFRGWSDGVNTNSRILDVSTEIVLEATYRLQYYLTVRSDYGEVLGEGWYDNGTVATFSVSPETVGGFRLEGWSGASNSSEARGSITINSPKVVVAKWKQGMPLERPIVWMSYNQPFLAIGGGIVVCLAAMAIYVSRRKLRLLKPPVLRRSESRRGQQFVDYLARLEELRSRNEISQATYEKLKEEYWTRIKASSDHHA
jgi:hypothetical protein